MKNNFDAIAEAKNIGIMEIMGRYYPSRLRAMPDGKYRGRCPFHNDKAGHDFTVDPHRRRFRCWSAKCGESGSGLDFVCLIKGVNPNDGRSAAEVAREVCSDFGLMPVETSGSTPKVAVKPREVKPMAPEVPKKALAQPEVLDAVYSSIFRGGWLTPAHRKYLKEVRHLRDDELLDYFSGGSMETDVTSLLTEVAHQLGAAKPGAHLERQFLHVPGLYLDNGKRVRVWAPKPTDIGCFVRDAKKRIIGIQLNDRRDLIEPTYVSEMKYRWLTTSRFDETRWDGDEAARAKRAEQNGGTRGTGAESKAAVIYPRYVTREIILVTEGIYKARALANHYGCPVISLQGVTSYRYAAEALEEICMGESFYFDLNPKQIVLVWDMDMFHNPGVFEALLAAKDAFLAIQHREPFEVDFACWNPDLGKGADDMLFATPDWKDRLLYVRSMDVSEIISAKCQELCEKEKQRSIKKLSAEGLSELQNALRSIFLRDESISRRKLIEAR